MIAKKKEQMRRTCEREKTKECSKSYLSDRSLEMENKKSPIEIFRAYPYCWFQYQRFWLYYFTYM